MIGVYARQSLDKKDSISIETQIDFCRKEITDNSEPKIYHDKGFSGKNTDRPEFKRMMGDIERGLISKIIVYRLDRISRSLTDFANIINVLEKHKVDFISTTEKFDTTTPVGRAMLYIIMVFAQLERETIAGRIKDNYYARGKSGVWLGGPPPLGYKIVKNTVAGKKISALDSTDEIEIVKKIYALYAETDASLGAVAKVLREEYGGMWNNIKLSRILHNPAYVRANIDVYGYYTARKCAIVNSPQEFIGTNGCSLYGKRDRGANKYRPHDNQVLALALHEGIINSGTWLKCQRKLEANRQVKNTGKGKHTWLTGLVKCGYCGYSVNVTLYKNNKYFNCKGRYVTDLCIDKLETHYVDDIEAYVDSALREYKIGKQSSSQPVDESAVNALKIQLFEIEQQIDNLVNNLAASNNILIGYVNKKITSLDAEKSALLREIELKSRVEDLVALPDMGEWDIFDNNTKRNISHRLISKVLLYNDHVEIVWKV